MSLLGRAAWLLRGLPSWSTSYSAILLSLISHAFATIVRAAFFFYPYSSSVPEDKEAVVVAEEAEEHPEDPEAVAGKETVKGEEALSSMVTSVESEVAAAGPPQGPVFTLAGGRVPLVPPGGRVPLSMVPKHCTIASSFDTPSSNFLASSPLSPRSPRDQSIVDMYCDDEFKLSLEYEPNMVLYPVDGLTSMEAELGRIDGSFLSMSLNSITSSLGSESGDEGSVVTVVPGTEVLSC